LGARTVCTSLGVVLRSQPYRDSDLIVTLFTQELGKVSALARAARRSQRRFAGALGSLVVSSFELTRSPRAELWTLESATVERQWLELAADVVAVAHASYVLELVRELVPAETPEPSILAMIVELWESLGAGPSAAVLRRVEFGLLELAGTAPVLDACAACGRALDAEQPCLFDPGRGGSICATCAPQSRGHGARPMSAAARRYLLEVTGAPSLTAARALEASSSADAIERIAGRDAMLGMIRTVVPHPLKTVEFIAKLAAGPGE
jgi:DNA repair protein RecO (recombination protein O)